MTIKLALWAKYSYFMGTRIAFFVPRIIDSTHLEVNYLEVILVDLISFILLNIYFSTRNPKIHDF